MRILVPVILLVLVAQPFRAAGTAQQPAKIDEFTPESPDVMPLVRAHRDYVADLLRSGRAHIGGPFAGDSPLRGVYPERPTAVRPEGPRTKAGPSAGAAHKAVESRRRREARHAAGADPREGADVIYSLATATAAGRSTSSPMR